MGYIVHTECVEMAAVLHGTSHVTTKQRFCGYSVDIQNALQKAADVHLESHATKAQ